MRVAIVMLAGCLYTGTFRDAGTPMAGKHVTFDCLDLAVTQTDDARATGPVIAYHFGNHCLHQIHVDLSAIHALGRYSDGTRPLVAYDPNHELRSMRLDARSTGREEIEYLAADAATPPAICVDVGGVEPGATASAHWLCFGSWDLGTGATIGFGKSDAPPLAMEPVVQTGWPLPAAIEPEVLAMPPRAQLDIRHVGGYLAARIPDQLRLVKALHDFVALRLDYDDGAREAIDRKDWDAVPSQEAEAVFASRRAVCAGYAHLMVALGEAAGVDIRYVTGSARDDGPISAARLGDHAHAWNAARIDGRWVLIDTTWDDGADGNVSSQYLFMPPGLFGSSHIPDEPTWQLVAPPQTIDEVLSQPWLGGRR